MRAVTVAEHDKKSVKCIHIIIVRVSLNRTYPLYANTDLCGINLMDYYRYYFLTKKINFIQNRPVHGNNDFIQLRSTPMGQGVVSRIMFKRDLLFIFLRFTSILKLLPIKIHNDVQRPQSDIAEWMEFEWQ